MLKSIRKRIGAKTTLVLLSIFLFLFLISSIAFAEPGKLGDINDDGKVNVLDVVLVMRHVLEIEELDQDQEKYADVNCDGKVNVQDVSLIMQYALDIIDRFPCEPVNQSFVRVFYNGEDFEDVYEGDILYLIHGESDREMQLMFHNRQDEDVIAENFIVDLMEDGVRERVWELRDTGVFSKTLSEGITRILDNLENEYAFHEVRVNDEDVLELRVDENVDTDPEWRDDIEMVFGAAALINDDGDNVWKTFVKLQDALDAADEDYTVTLYDDVEEDITINHEGLTIDLNGNEIDGDVTVAADDVAIDGEEGSAITGNLHIYGKNVTLSNDVALTGSAADDKGFVHFYAREYNLTYTGSRGHGSVYHYDLEKARVANATELYNALFVDQAEWIMFDDDITVGFDLELNYPGILIDLNNYTLASNSPGQILIDAADAEISGGTLDGWWIRVRDGLQDPLIADVTFKSDNTITLGMPWVSRARTTLYFGDIEVAASGSLTLNARNTFPYSPHDDYGFLGVAEDTTISGAGLVALADGPIDDSRADFHNLTFNSVDVEIYNRIRMGDITFNSNVDLMFKDETVGITVLNNRTVSFNNDVDIDVEVTIDAEIDTGALLGYLDPEADYLGTFTGSGSFDIVSGGRLNLRDDIRILDFHVSGDDINVVAGDVFFKDISPGQFSQDVVVGNATMQLLSDFGLETASNNIVLDHSKAVLDGNGFRVYGSSGQVQVNADDATIKDVEIIPDLDLGGHDVKFMGTVETNDVLNADDVTITMGPALWIMNEELEADNLTLKGTGTVDGRNNNFVGDGALTIDGTITLINTGWSGYDYVDVPSGKELTLEGVIDNQDIISIAGWLKNNATSLTTPITASVADITLVDNTDFDGFSYVPYKSQGITLEGFNLYEGAKMSITLSEPAYWGIAAEDAGNWNAASEAVRSGNNRTLTLTLKEEAYIEAVPNSTPWIDKTFGSWGGSDYEDVIRTTKYESHDIAPIIVEFDGAASDDFLMELISD